MKSILNIQYQQIILTFMLGLFFLGSCTNTDEDLDKKPTPVSHIVNFTATASDIRIVSTRSMAGYAEDEIGNIGLLLFDATDPNNELFLEYCPATNLRQDGDQITFSANLSPTDVTTRVVVVANADMASLVSGFTVSTDKKTAMEALVHVVNNGSDTDWKWHATDGDYTRIPMYGEVVVAGINPQMPNITGIELIRMLARIDVINSSSDFIVDDVYLVNYNTKGNIAPAWNSSGQIIDPMPDDPLMPSDAGKKTGSDYALLYDVNGANSYEGEIYAYESAAAIDDWDNFGASSRKDAVCLVVKGRKGSAGTSYYYRVDFTNENVSLPWTNYIALKRNFKYIINIEQVDGVGYGSVAEAIDSYTVLSNLKTRLIYYSRTVIKDVVFNGQNMLGLGESKFSIDRLLSKQSVKVFTDNPSGWEASISADWLSFVNGTESNKLTKGVANDDTSSLTFVASNFENASSSETRTAEITVTAGRLSQKITVTQSGSDDNISLRLIDESGNSVNRIDFSYNKYDEIEAKRFYITWSGVDKCYVSRAGTPTITYETLDPTINLGGEGMVDFSGGIQAITIKPDKGNDTQIWTYTLWDNFSFMLFDTGGSPWVSLKSINIQVELRGAAIEADVDANGYLMGNHQYSLNVRSNVPWKIQSIVEEPIISGNLLATSGGTLVQNATGGSSSGSVQTDVLTFTTADWILGLNGKVKVIFTSTDPQRPVTEVVELNLRSSMVDYTNNSSSWFYLYPKRFEDSEGNGILMDRAEGQLQCERFGAGWRLPTMNELVASYVFRFALGNMNYNSNYGWYWGHHWSNSYIDRSGIKYYTTDMGNGFSGWNGDGNSLHVRCVYSNPSQSKKYPYIEARSDGPVIVSSDSDGGVASSALFSGTTVPPLNQDYYESDQTYNRIAPKLQIANADENSSSADVYNWAEAKAKCTQKGTGWRLPTQREAMLIWAMGGTESATITINNNPVLGDWSSVTSFQKMKGADYVFWLSTSRAAIAENDATLYAWFIDVETLNINAADQQIKGFTDYNYGGVRCVRSVN